MRQDLSEMASEKLRPATNTPLIPNESAPSARRPPLADPLFDEFWAAYPRKVGKVGAHRTWERITRRGVAGRLIIAAALREHPEASHREIARLIGVNHQLVDHACKREVDDSSTSGCTHGRTGQGARNDLTDGGDRPRQPTPLEEKIEPIIREHPERSNNQVLAEAGLTRNHHAVAARVRDRLEEEGTIPPAPVREGSDGSMRHVATHARPGVAAPAGHREPAWKRAKPSSLIQRITRLVTRWESEDDDPSSELEELEALRREIDERIETLRG